MAFVFRRVVHHVTLPGRPPDLRKLLEQFGLFRLPIKSDLRRSGQLLLGLSEMAKPDVGTERPLT
jgi:hypothetical protein